jgi:hypothetical protein
MGRWVGQKTAGMWQSVTNRNKGVMFVIGRAGGLQMPIP